MSIHSVVFDLAKKYSNYLYIPYIAMLKLQQCREALQRSLLNSQAYSSLRCDVVLHSGTDSDQD
jgi:hypothetical protein